MMDISTLPETYDLQDEWADFLKAYSPGETHKIVAVTPGGGDAGAGTGVSKPAKELTPGLETQPDPGYILNISTKTKILYLDSEIDIQRTFWAIPVIEYWRPTDGVVKKQMKFVSRTMADVDDIHARLVDTPYFNEYIIRQINNPDARSVKFKDERKITIGLSKKDVMCCRGKPKNAFYNCFAMVLRIMYKGAFREVHVKVFKTGKLEIPGVADDDLLYIARASVISVLAPITCSTLSYDVLRPDTDVLINSNFNCGFFIDRNAAHALLRSPVYDIEAVYDPCNYPGIKCKYYYDTRLEFDDPAQTGRISVADRSLKLSELIQTHRYIEISFMIFRTGSALIVGNCNERILRVVFSFISRFLARERTAITSAGLQPVAAKTPRAIRVHKKSITQTK